MPLRPMTHVCIHCCHYLLLVFSFPFILIGFAIVTFGSTFIGESIAWTPRAICCSYSITVFPCFTFRAFLGSFKDGICASSTRLACIGFGFGVVSGFTIKTRFRPNIYILHIHIYIYYIYIYIYYIYIYIYILISIINKIHVFLTHCNSGRLE